MSLEGSLDVDVRDDAVEFAFTVTNAGDDPVELTFRTGQVADVVVSRDGTEVWAWSDGRMFTQAIQTRSLGPGDSFTADLVWENPHPGEYTAEATLEAADATVVDRANFTVD